MKDGAPGGDDPGTFRGDFIAAMPQIEFPAGIERVGCLSPHDLSGVSRPAALKMLPHDDYGTPAVSMGPALVTRFVVSKAGQMYDAPESGPNRKSRLRHPYGYVLVF